MTDAREMLDLKAAAERARWVQREGESPTAFQLAEDFLALVEEYQSLKGEKDD